MIRHHGNMTELTTENDRPYQFFPVSCGSIQFKVQAKNDAHLVLTTGTQESDPMYEVIIGGWGNTKSVIRKNKAKLDKVTKDTPGILDGNEYRSFWVRWDNGTISVGREGDRDHLLTWTDPEPFLINFVGVCTGWGSTGKWKIEDEGELYTPDKLEYKFRPITTGYLEFEYRGSHSAQICLTNEPGQLDYMYEVVLGGENNTQSSITRRSRTPNKVVVTTPGLLHPNESRKFLIQWTNGSIVARNGTTGAVLMKWSDPTPFPVTHFGVRTGRGARGTWSILHFPETAPQNLKIKSSIMVRHHGNVMDVITENDPPYQFFPISCGSVQFKIQAKNDAHLILTAGTQEADPMYEIIIGGWGNTKSVIRRNKAKLEKNKKDTPGILDGNEYRSFWVRWDNGTVSVGREAERDHFLTWTDPQPFPIAFVGVCTGWGATGKWKIEDAEEFHTPDKMEYKFRPITTGYVQFEYRGPHSAHLCLTNEPAEVDLMYEFILGEENNTLSSITRHKKVPNKVVVTTPGLLHVNEFRKFLIQWTNGRMVARDGTSGAVLLDWEDRSSFPVTHFGIRSGQGARGHWRIQHFPETAPENQTLPPEETAGTIGKWVGAHFGEVPPGAIVAGEDSSGEPVYVVRAAHKTAIIPGKLISSRGYAGIPWGGAEFAKSSYQVLVGGSNNWVATSGANIPTNAFPSGQTEDKEPLFVGRVTHEGSVVTGKVQKSHKTCYIPYNGVEVGFSEYEILVF